MVFTAEWKFFIIFSVFSSFGAVYAEEELDILLPFPENMFHEATRSHRYVRDCQPIRYGNLTNESIYKTSDSNLSPYEVRYISYEFGDKGRQYGHHIIVRNPLKLISVLEPGGKGGCANQNTSTVSTTATAHNCAAAINAGFFNPIRENKNYGKCYGNIISNGRYVQDSDGVQNANFGIRKDGTITVGYLSEEDVQSADNPFVQLINGVGWVLRNGKEYLNESVVAECKDTQTTGSLRYFFDVQSARTLIGFDSNGFVHLVQFDGRTNTKGINLRDAAIYLQAAGVTNAINLDGGGSATYVLDSIVVNYPSDVCANKNDIVYNCPRKVSTVICVKGKTSDSPTVQPCSRDVTIKSSLVVLFFALFVATRMY